MDAEELRRLAAKGEGQHLELKHSAPKPQSLATELASFANAQGGRLVIGIDERGSVVGAKRERVEQALAQAKQHVSPSIQVDVERVELDSKDVLVVTIPRGDEFPYLANGFLVKRVGVHNAKITGAEILHRVTERAQTPSELLLEVRRLGVVIETINVELGRSRGWRSRLVDMVVGGLIGTVISLAVAALIAAF
jgi:predicted HTH transcriptional regulator